MKGWVWAIALIITLAVSGCTAASESSPKVSESAERAASSPQPTETISPSPKLVLPADLPQADVNQLIQHVQALAFERYTEVDRDRARQYIIKTLKSFGWQPDTQRFKGGINLIAQRSGTNASAGTILVTAHYDTVQQSPGADDNASAIAAALEIARLLGSRPTPHPLQLVFFDQEEQGLLGSLAFTANSKNLVNLDGVINLEMLGYTCRTAGCQQLPEGLPIALPTDKGDFLGVVGDREHEFLLQAFRIATHANLPAIITLPVPFKGVMTPDLLRSDHAPFWVNNIGAVMVTDTANFRNPNYHQPSDTFETIDFKFLAGATQLVLNAITVLLESQG